MELTAAAITFRTSVLPLHRSRGRGDAGGRFAGSSNVGIGYIRVLMRSRNERTRVLLAQMHQLKTEQEGLKRMLKEKKVILDKSKVVRVFKSSSSSSSSSESSDSECNNNWFRSRAMIHSQEATASANSVIQRENSCSSERELSCSNGCKEDEIEIIVEGPTTQKIEVCMDEKCRELGAAALLENLERKLGVDVDVFGCKCLGRCNNGPNVRTLNHEGSSGDSTGQPNNHPTIIGVGDDVDLDFKIFLGKDIKD